MKAKSSTKKENTGISDATVKTATGKRWDQWFAILDKQNATTLSHTEIARYLFLHHLDNNGWWCQMIANRYEIVNGLRKKYENSAGFQVTASKIIPVSVTDIYAAWMDEAARKKWLGKVSVEITTVTPNVSIRMIWSDKRTRVGVGFLEKGSTKTQVAVAHSKIPEEADALKKKQFWKKKLNDLSTFLL